MTEDDGQRPRALHDVFDINARTSPQQLAAVDGAGDITYEQLVHTSHKLSAVLLERWVECGSARPLMTCLPRNCSWLSVYVASMRCRVPMMALSAEMKDRATETRRNRESLHMLQPQLLVTGDVLDKSCVLDELLGEARTANIEHVTISDLLCMGFSVDLSTTRAIPLPKVSEDDLLAYCFTGGTTKASKAVRITHAMALHECRCYAEILPPGLCGGKMRFLQNSSAYWGAALLGQLDVAFAVNGTAVMCEASLPAEIAHVVQQFEVSCFGAVPSVLAHLDPEELSTVQCVFSWADYLPDTVASRWRAKVPLRDLLIATEYWLALYSTFDFGRSLQPVSGVEVQIVSPDGCDLVCGTGVGELCLAGPTVFPGYVDASFEDGRWVDIGGRRYFRTRDLVRWIEHKRLEYCGRCDDMVKVGGKWVDISALEERILKVPCVHEVKLVFGTQRRVFIVLKSAPTPESSNGMWPRALEVIRKELPAGVLVHIVSSKSLPVHAATGKVDRQALLRAVQEEDLSTIVGPRRKRVTDRLTRAYNFTTSFCLGDARRMLCLAYIWYSLIFCSDYRRIKSTLDSSFPSQGGARGVMLAFARALPLPLLQRLAEPGAAMARAAGRYLDWVAIFWMAIPYWLPNTELNAGGARWTHDLDRCIEHTITKLQVFAARWVKRTCVGCNSCMVTLFPSTTHCCNSCEQSNGTRHDETCLQQPKDGLRKCDNCNYTATWDFRFCCYTCQRWPGTHGPHCDERPFVVEEPTAQIETELPSHQKETTDESPEQAAPENSGVAVSFEKQEERSPAEEDAETEQGDADEDEDGNGLCDADAPSVDETALAGLVARVIGAESASAVAAFEFGPLDSLRALRLIALLRQDFGCALTLRDIASCTNISQLAVRMREAPRTERQPFPAPGPSGFRLWTFGWGTCLQWLFSCQHLLDLEAVEAAVVVLMRRHPALRLRFKEPLEVQQRFMEAAVVLDVLRASSMAASGRIQPVQHVAMREGACALQNCWPRWHTPECGDAPGKDIFLHEECAVSEVEEITRRMRKHFLPPFQIALLRHPDTARTNNIDVRKAHPSSEQEDDDDVQIADRTAKCHICVMLSHAISDGSAIIPFIQDFARLLEECERLREQHYRRCQEPSRWRRCLEKKLPLELRRPLPHFGAILEDRLLRSLPGDDSQEDLMYLNRRMDFFKHHFPEDLYNGYSQCFHVNSDELQILKSALDAHLGHCPIELALLSMIVLSLARVDGKSRVKFSLVHHGRDHPPGAADCVGFFTDFRTLVVPTSELVSLLGVFSFVSTSVRERSWRIPEVLEPIDNLINIVPSPFAQVGCLSQAAWFGKPGHRGNTSWPSDGSVWQTKKTSSCQRPLECQLEQVDAAEWSITMYLDAEHYPPEKGQRFRTCWLRVLQDLRERPLQGVLSSPSQMITYPKRATTESTIITEGT